MINSHKKYHYMLTHILDVVAHACARGEFGNGQTRTHSLKEAGFSPAQIREIQRRVNTIISNRNKDIK